MDIRCQRQLKLPMHICANRERSRLEAPHASSLPASMNLTKQPDAGNAAEFAWRRDDVFGRIASRYDLLCDVFSLGIHRLWKRRVARRIADEPWNVLLDGATGTGDIILRLMGRQATEGRAVIAADVSPGMLAIASRRLSPWTDKVQLRQLDAEAMPAIADGNVDAYSMSLVMKICDRSEEHTSELQSLMRTSYAVFCLKKK